MKHRKQLAMPSSGYALAGHIVHYAYKIERYSPRSRFYVIRKFLHHYELLTFHIEDSNLGLVSNLAELS
jgi:hypothetical protein